MQQENSPEVSNSTVTQNPQMVQQMPITATSLPQQQVSQDSQQFQYAGFWVRFAAGLIDGSIFLLLYIITFHYAHYYDQFNMPGLPDYKSSYVVLAWDFILMFALAFVVTKIILIKLIGATPGKMLFDAKIINKYGKKPGLKTALIRESGSIITGLIFSGIGFLWIAFDKEKQAVHDKLASTHVILLRPLGIGKKILIILAIVLGPVLAAYVGRYFVVIRASSP